MSDGAPRPAVLAGVVLGLLVLSSVAGAYAGSTPVTDAELVSVGDDAAVFPYVSRTDARWGSTAAVNVVVRADHDSVRRLLARDTTVRWEPDEHAGERVEPVQPVAPPWRETASATRYALIEDAHGTEWRPHAFQVQAGDYLGERYHLRAFRIEGETDELTAIQAHREYWDWFVLGHVVTSTEGGRTAVVDDLTATVGTASVDRRKLAPRDAFDGNGWASMISLAVVPVVGAVGVSRLSRRLRAALPVDVGVRTAGLAAVVPLVYLAVRLLGVAIEKAPLDVSLDFVALALYPVVLLGLPLGAAVAAWSGDSGAASLVVLGTAGALVLDYATMGVVPPAPVAVARFAAVVALGAVAAGVHRYRARGERAALLVGVTAWLLAIAWPALAPA